jgi:hypothetical protein
VLVLGADLATLLAHTWTAACLGTGAVPWPDWLARHRDRLPRRVDLPAVLERQLARPHVGQVTLVLDHAAVPGLLGVRALPPRPSVTWVGAELSRRVGSALSLLVLPDEQARLLDEVWRPRLPAGPAPGVPGEHEEWVAEAAAGVHRQVLRAGYSVVGDPAALLQGSPDIRGSRRVLAVATDKNRQERPRSDVLDLAVRTLLEGAR